MKKKIKFTAYALSKDKKTQEKISFTAKNIVNARHKVINSLDMSKNWTVLYD